MNAPDIKQRLDPSQLELREITWNSAKQLIAQKDLTEEERNTPQGAVLKTFLVNKEKVYPTNEIDLNFHRLSDEPLAMASGALGKGFKHANHAFGLFMPGSKRPEVVVYTQLRYTGARNNGDIPDYTKLPGSIDECRHYGGTKPQHPDTIIFYSISNTERAKFAGSLGQQLISRIAARLRGQDNAPFFDNDTAVPVLPEITTLTTLSPIPGFNKWLAQLSAEQLTPHERKTIGAHFGIDASTGLLKATNRAARKDSSDLNRTLEKLCLVYLNTTKPNGRGDEVEPINGVEKFHVAGNGALLANLHAADDLSSTGQNNALGLMANYLYEDEKSHAVRVESARKGNIPMSPHLHDMLRERQCEANGAGVVTPTASIPVAAHRGD